MKKNIISILSISITVVIGIVLAIMASNTMAYQDDENYVLFYNDNMEILKDDLKYFIDKVDDYLLPNSSFIYSDILTENYDFLTNFALDYIINNKTYYNDLIVTLDNYSYLDKHYNSKSTNEYINKEEIYKITNMFFGIKDYVIINDNIKEVNDYVSLTDYNGVLFKGNIDNIEINNHGDYLNCIVYYDSGDKYNYIFINNNNVLKLYNVEV